MRLLEGRRWTAQIGIEYNGRWCGEVPERPNGRDWKSRRGFTVSRGFESRPLRQPRPFPPFQLYGSFLRVVAQRWQGQSNVHADGSSISRMLRRHNMTYRASRSGETSGGYDTPAPRPFAEFILSFHAHRRWAPPTGENGLFTEQRSRMAQGDMVGGFDGGLAESRD